MNNWKIISLGVIIPIVVFVIFFSFPKNEYYAIPLETQIISTENQTPIIIGTVHRDAAKIIERFQPTANYLAENLTDKQTEYYGKVIVTKSLDEMIDLLNKQQIDLYFDSSFTSVVVSEKTNSVPFLIRWKENSESYHSIFFVEKNSKIESINDFKGKTIVFQSPESTSGYLLPLYYLKEHEITVGENKDMNFAFSYDDENTPNWILENKAEIGVISNLDFRDLPEDMKPELKIIEKTDDVPRQFVSYRSELDSKTIEKITDVLLNMHQNALGREILDDFKHTEKYTKISDEQILEKISKMTRVE